MAPFPGRGRDGADSAVPRGVEHIEQARFANTGWSGDGRDFSVQRLTQLGDALASFRTEVIDRVDIPIAVEQASRQRRFIVGAADVEIHLVDADDCWEAAGLRHHQKSIEQAQVRLGIPYRKEKERLIRIRQDDLLDVVGMTGEPGKRARSRFDRFDTALAFADVSDEDPIPDGDKVGPAPVPLEDTLDGGEQLLAVRQRYGEELAVGTDDHARQCVRRWGRAQVYVSCIRSGTWPGASARGHRRLMASDESDGSPSGADIRWTRQGGAIERPLHRAVHRGRALGTDASLTQEPGATMGTGGAGAALEAAAIETTIGIDAVVAAERGSADGGAFRVGRARPTKSDVASAATATNRLTDTLGAIEPATTLGARGAATTLIAAAVQSAIAGDSVVVAEDRAAYLAAFARLGTLPTEPDGPATTSRGATCSIDAEETTTADGVSIT
jgi:hypothetical protein